MLRNVWLSRIVPSFKPNYFLWIVLCVLKSSLSGLLVWHSNILNHFLLIHLFVAAEPSLWVMWDFSHTHTVKTVKNIGNPVFISENAPLVPGNCCKCYKCFGHVHFFCWHWKDTKNPKPPKSDTIHIKRQKCPAQNYWHPQLNTWYF